MQIRIFQGGFDKNLSYLVWCEHTRMAALIDASVETQPIWDMILEKNLILSKILITHSHSDHINYVNDLLEYKPLVKIHGYHKVVNSYGFGQFHGVEHHEVISIGQHLLTVLYTPGHFSDSICFWSKEFNIVFTGDTMFIGRPGRTINKNSDIRQLYNSIYQILIPLKPETVIYPGHHYGRKRNMTIEENIQTSQFFSCSSFNEFKTIMEKFEQGKRK